MNYSFDDIANMLDDIVDSIPDDLLNNLNGIYLVDETRHNPKIPSDNYYIMGDFTHSPYLGHSINIYYGSVVAMHDNLSKDAMNEKLKEIVHHELRHHMETQAGCDDLVRLDELFVKQALKSIQPAACNPCQNTIK